MNNANSENFPAWTWEEIRREPYRLLFPMGLAHAMIGIGAWIPFYFWPQAIPYPGGAHAVLQLQGFLLSFILGFLTTMLPKVLGIQPLGPVQFSIFPIGLAALALCAWVDAPHSQAAVQVLHLILLGNFLVFILRRWSQRRGSPPAAFQFVALAMASEIIGTVLRLLVVTSFLGDENLRMALLLQYQAFPLLLILGIGSFLLPKLFGNAVVDPQTLRGQAAGSALVPLLWGGVLLIGFAIEGIGKNHLPGAWAVRIGGAVRTAVWIWFLFSRLRIHTVTWKLPSYLMGARYSIAAIGFGMLMPVLFPDYLLAWEHVIFIAGFLWLTLSVASRVISAHGGRLNVLENHGRKALAYGILIVMAMGSRVLTDLFTRGRWLHLASAGALALASLALWGWIYVPLLFQFPGRMPKKVHASAAC